MGFFFFNLNFIYTHPTNFFSLCYKDFQTLKSEMHFIHLFFLFFGSFFSIFFFLQSWYFEYFYLPFVFAPALLPKIFYYRHFFNLFKFEYFFIFLVDFNKQGRNSFFNVNIWNWGDMHETGTAILSYILIQRNDFVIL